MAQTVFSRYEKKYMMEAGQFEEFMDAVAGRMETDQYGEHTICNIYYDTPDSLLIRRSVEKPRYKEKLRLRSYGVPGPESTVFLEIKKKYNRVVNKRRIPLKLQEAYDYMDKGIRPQQDSQILHEIDFMLERYPLERSLYLAYDRIAMFDKDDPDFRITFDRNIRSRRSDVALEKGDDGSMLLADDVRLMETKILGATPLWFSHILAELRIRPVSFSKYGTIYKRELAGA